MKDLQNALMAQSNAAALAASLIGSLAASQQEIEQLKTKVGDLLLAAKDAAKVPAKNQAKKK